MNSVPAVAVAVDSCSYRINSENFNARWSLLQPMEGVRSCTHLLNPFQKEQRQHRRH